MSYSYTMSIWVSNSSSNLVTRAQNVLLIMSLSHSLKLSCAKRMVLILSKRAPSPHELVYGTSFPVLSKTVQSKLQ